MDRKFTHDELRNYPRVFSFTEAEKTYYVKQNSESKIGLTSHLQSLLYYLTGNPMAMPTVLPKGENPILFESAQLLALENAGINVPHVIYRSPDYFIMTDSGISAENYLNEHPEKVPQILNEIAVEMGKLHAAGFAHGGAQIRNYTLIHHRIGLIDFEENVRGKHLFDYQVLDLMLLLQSLQKKAYRFSLREFFASYEAITGNQNHRKRLYRFLHHYRWFAWLSERAIFKRYRLRDVRTFATLIRRAEQELVD